MDACYTVPESLEVIEGFHALGPSLVFPTSMEPPSRREGKFSIEKIMRRLRVGQNMT